MAGPWERYQAPSSDGPWTRYQAPQASAEAQASSQPSLFRMDSDFREKSGAGFLPMLGATVQDMFGFREKAAQTLANASEGGQATVDERGEPAVRLPTGEVYRLNDPGLDSTDIANVAGNVAAFWTPAAWAARMGQAKNLGLLTRMGLQGGTAAATDAALQGAAGQEVDPSRTGLAALGGAGGEALGTGLGALARMARPASQEARMAAPGIASTPARAPAVARELDAGASPAAKIGQERYGFQYTQGQRMADPEQQFRQLSREELLRQSPGGGEAFRRMDSQNAQQLDTVLNQFGERLGGRPGATPAEMAQGAASELQTQASGLQEQIGQAYAKAAEGDRTSIASEAIGALPERLTRATSEFSPNSALTPATAKTLQQVRNAARMVVGTPEKPSNVAGVTLKALETQRRIINNNIGAAANPADRAAMTALKREFDSWLDDSIDGAMISGDRSALEAIKEARGLRAEFGRRFEGGRDTDRFISGLLDGSKTPEELVNIALGASQVSKGGGARFINRLREAAAGDPGAIEQLRAAHFLRMTRGANGEPLSMGQLVRNIKQTEYSNASVVKALYSPQEWSQVKELASALEPLVPKGDFARTSGTAERLLRMLFQRVGNIPFVGWAAKFPQETAQAIRADRAINAPLKLQGQTPSIVPAAGAGYSAAGGPLELDIVGGTPGAAPTETDLNMLRGL